jgi:hypothetical protein
MLPPCLSRRRGCGFFGGVTRQRQEDVIERGAPEPEVVNGDSGVVENAADLHELLHAAVAWQRDAALVFIDGMVAVTGTRQLFGGPGNVGAIVQDDLDAFAANAGL